MPEKVHIVLFFFATLIITSIPVVVFCKASEIKGIIKTSITSPQNFSRDEYKKNLISKILIRRIKTSKLQIRRPRIN